MFIPDSHKKHMETLTIREIIHYALHEAAGMCSMATCNQSDQDSCDECVFEHYGNNDINARIDFFIKTLAEVRK